jgi:hypothetical protein
MREDVSVGGKFSLEYLHGLNDLESVIQYVRSTLKRLGSGSFRDTWIVDGNRILKVIRRKENREQNSNEVKHATCLGSHYAPNILDYDKENFYWILEERLNPIGGEALFGKLQELIGYKFSGWQELKFFFVYGSTSLHNDPSSLVYKLYNKSEWLKGLFDELEGCKVDTSDFHDENWGVRPSTGELVLLDLGF